MLKLIKNSISNLIYHYNHEKFWKDRSIIIDNNNKCPQFIKALLLLRVKRSEAFSNAYFGTTIGGGAKFLSPPILPHGLNGIVVSCYAEIGNNCTILQQVTIGQVRLYDPHAPKIGDNVYIGAGAKIFGAITIGNNVVIGSNSVVIDDIPDNCTVVGIPAKIIKMNGKRVDN